MKKFEFSLETVLNYKEETENSLRNEHGICLHQVMVQEQKIDAIREKAEAARDELNQKKASGFDVLEIQTFEHYLNYLSGELKKELRVLDGLKKKEEEKRTELIAAQTETKSMNKLKENRLCEYKKMELKQEERDIDELISRRERVSL